MGRALRVVHGLGEDDLILGDPTCAVEEGVLMVYADKALRQVIKSYNRDVWATAAYEEVP